MTPHQEIERFERKRGRRFTPAQRQEILQSLGLSLGIPGGVSPGSNSVPTPADLTWTGLQQLFQADRGLNYDTTLAATTGNTSTTAVTIANSSSVATCAVLVRATNSATIPAATFNVYTDGTGTTPIMTGVTPTAGVPVALTGFPGVTLTWSAGTGVNNDTWNAAAATWTDQATSPHNATAAGTARPIITPGTGGKIGLKGDGSLTNMASTLNLSGGGAPSATNLYVYVLARMLSTPGGNACLYGVPGGTRIGIYCTAAPLIVQYNGALVNGSTPTISTWYLLRAKFIGTTGDSLQLGSAAAVTGATAQDNTPITGFNLFASGASFRCPCEIMFAAVSTSPAPAGLGAAITAWCGVTEV